jgi:hypothetical protein
MYKNKSTFRGVLKLKGLTVQHVHVACSRFVECLLKKPVKFEGVPPLRDDLATSVAPIFVLSTGRCGTMWLTELLLPSSKVFVNHALQPELVRQSKLAYEGYVSNVETLVEIARATRDDLISAAYQADRVYVETNNRITFFAWALLRAYPGSKFIHLYRHPADFVRSGMRRDWYGGHPWDIGRITMKSIEEWEKLSRLEQIAWLWNETNAFIEIFLDSLEPERYMSLKSEQMFFDKETARRICQFVGALDLPGSHIEKMQTKRINVQQSGSFPKYEEWSIEQKQLLRQWCPLASKYGYDLSA